MRVLTLLALIQFISHPVSANSNSACSFESTLKPMCEEIESLDKSQTDDLPRSWHGSNLPSSKLLKSQVDDFNNRPDKAKLTPEEKKKFSAALEKAKAHAERVILLGPDRVTLRSESELTDAEKAVLDRIRKTKLSALDTPLHQMTCTEQGHIGHAVTTPDIIICPILSGYSEAALVHAIGIFIGRGLTECASTLPKELGGTLSPIKWADHPFNSCVGSGCSSLKQCLSNGSDGQIQETSSANINFDSPVAKESIAKILKLAAATERNLPSEDQLKKMLTPMIKSHPSCFHQYNGSQEDSAMSYWFGAEVASSFNASEELAGRTVDAKGSIAYFVDDACRFHKLKDIRSVNGHPTHQARFERAMLRSTPFRKLMGCPKPVSESADCQMRKPSFQNEKPARRGTGSPSSPNEIVQ